MSDLTLVSEGDVLGEVASPSDQPLIPYSEIKPPTIRCLWVVTCEHCNDYRRFDTAHEASDFQTEHHVRYHVRRRA